MCGQNADQGWLVAPPRAATSRLGVPCRPRCGVEHDHRTRPGMPRRRSCDQCRIGPQSATRPRTLQARVPRRRQHRREGSPLREHRMRSSAADGLLTAARRRCRHDGESVCARTVDESVPVIVATADAVRAPKASRRQHAMLPLPAPDKPADEAQPCGSSSGADVDVPQRLKRPRPKKPRTSSTTRTMITIKRMLMRRDPSVAASGNGTAPAIRDASRSPGRRNG